MTMHLSVSYTHLATSEVGPFYCPADQMVYIDLDFFTLLASRFKAPGDLAMAYVTAHEVGHHVQNLLGISDKLHQQQGRVSQEAYNRASVCLLYTSKVACVL